MIIFFRKFKYKFFSPIRKELRKKYKKYKTKRKISISKIFLIMGLLISSILICFINIEPIICDLAKCKIKNFAAKVANDVVISEIENAENIELEKITRGKDGLISSIETNEAKLNILKSKIVQKIEEKFQNLQYGEIYVPIGSIIKNEMLYSRGPKIPIKIIILNSLDANLESKFLTSGINQTKHEVSLKIKINATALLPFGKTEAEAVTDIPLSETIIVGPIPSACLNIQN